ncbi:unnamed protein product [Phytomonas sp. EM1]|nr:unnamed protein product [Phytomonas sp. EM1]|eukprot:CCW65021.1 unnamed protein product [Phytomonas sp. isolate EM1]
MSAPPLYSYLGRASGTGGGGLPAIPNALLPNTGVAPSYARAGGDSHRKRHALRRSQKEALMWMIKSAVPLDSDAHPPPSAGGGGPEVVASALGGGGAGEGGGGTAPPPSIWRLLIFDDWGRDIIAPLLKVADLRELGITLYMHIQTEREPVPGAPAIYLCAPTPENLDRLVVDCSRRLYEWVYLNFAAPVPRGLLERLARGLSESALPAIAHLRVFDRMLSYVALDEDLFSLMQPRSFWTLNRRGAAEAVVEVHLTAVVEGVLHVLLTMGGSPVIAHSRTGAAEAMAGRLATRLRDAAAERLLPPAAAFGRPLLLLVDRSTDLATALHHPFSYRGLLVEHAGMRLNKCHLRAEGGREEVFEIDPERDRFYAENGALDFAEIGARIEAALREYQEAYTALAATTTPGEAGAEGDGEAEGGMSRLLATAPLLAERKRYLDMHTHLAYDFLQRIRASGWDRLHGVELALLRRGRLDKEEFARLLRGRNGSRADRQRLFLIAHLLCGQQGGEEGFVQQQLPYLTAADEPGEGKGKEEREREGGGGGRRRRRERRGRRRGRMASPRSRI